MTQFISSLRALKSHTFIHNADDSIIAATAKAHQVELLTLDKNLANKL
jgi:predicted nucleic acid-binding protein